jgi:hypothetical protein
MNESASGIKGGYCLLIFVWIALRESRGKTPEEM